MLKLILIIIAIILIVKFIIPEIFGLIILIGIGYLGYRLYCHLRDNDFEIF